MIKYTDKKYKISEELLLLLFDYFILENHSIQNEERIKTILMDKHDAIMRRTEYSRKLNLSTQTND